MIHPVDRVLLFRRDYRGLTGGHLKVWHYFGHAGHSARFQPRIYFTPESDSGPDNPWHGMVPPPLASWEPQTASALFVAGLDWEAVPDPAPSPVINLVQGVRHADPGDPRHRYLRRPAIRICVSVAVASAIEATGIVNGPIHVIANGIDLGELPASSVARDIPLLVVGMKHPSFALAVCERLRHAGIETECLIEPLPRKQFLARLARSSIVVTIPFEQEGFYLPALEAMAVGAVVICPDCVGNRGFCRDAETAFRPAYTIDAVVEATIRAASQPEPLRATMRRAAADEVEKHGLPAERLAFLRILDAL